MRSTRALFTGAAIAATLTLGAPAAAFAADVSDPGGHGGYSSSQESSEDGYGQGGSSWKDKDDHGREEGREDHRKEEEEHGKEEMKGKDEGEEHEFGHGKEEGKEEGKEHEFRRDHDFGREHDRDHDWSGGSWKDHEKGEKPRGGVHTGGGGLANTGSGMAAGSVLLLGGLGAGAYALRRRKPTGTAI
ncbi:MULTISPECIES: hypothetical protein [Streptomyces]|uniref:Uncharacterized protein n=1 Tax=Streptomyces malaysiensis TaxID=92644 RepID=A0A291SZT1_STRMQ|nr:hypothetical protein [Streptomyces malaysiensis]ATL86367.1 spore germination protein [Streptomyces malaysiensis]NIY69172.1 hypothetical protein [Streptomyces malaysiensis]QDL70056.1 hypothetical protein DNK48_12225 [Streptomyces malaysiensis]